MPRTIKTLCQEGIEILGELANSRLETEVLLKETFGITREQIWIYPETLIKDSLLINKYYKRLQKRSRYIPMAQILGKKSWKHLELIINDKVLIPRDETEILVDHITLDMFQNFPKNFNGKILDVGTGSGCIAIYLSQKFPKAKVLAIDINQEALSIAKKNANSSSVNIDFIESNLLEKLPDCTTIDIIVANLPYVPLDFPVSKDLIFEPSQAIFAEDNGLALIKKLHRQIIYKSINFKTLWLEFLPFQQKKIHEIFGKFTVEFFEDVSGEVFFAKITKHKNSREKMS